MPVQMRPRDDFVPSHQRPRSEQEEAGAYRVSADQPPLPTPPVMGGPLQRPPLCSLSTSGPSVSF